MPRLVTFGCSFTYGSALEDTYEFKPGPSIYAWPNIAAKELNFECINKGIPGAGNKEILHYIQHFDFLDDDIVCVLWTYLDRWCVIKEDSIDNFLARRKDRANQYYYQFLHDKHDLWLDSFTRINFAKLFLDKKSIKNLHFVMHNTILEKVPTWSKVNFENMFMDEYRFKHPLGLDDAHPGEAAHQEFGLEVAKRINSFISC